MCAQYCDADQPCPQGLSCEGLTVKLGAPASYPVIHVCQVPAADASVCLLEGSTCQSMDGASGNFPEVGSFDVTILSDVLRMR